MPKSAKDFVKYVKDVAKHAEIGREYYQACLGVTKQAYKAASGGFSWASCCFCYIQGI